MNLNSILKPGVQVESLILLISIRYAYPQSLQGVGGGGGEWNKGNKNRFESFLHSVEDGEV